MAGPWEQYGAQPAPAADGPWSAYAAPQEAPQHEGITADNVVRSVARGVPLLGHLADKGNAAIYSALAPVFPGDQTVSHAPSFGERYDENLATQTRKNQTFDQEHPVVSTGAKIAGGVASLAPVAATGVGGAALGVTGGNLLTRMAAGGATNAAIGAGDAAVGGEDPVRGAAYGAAGGAAGPVVGQVAGPAVRAVAEKLSIPKFAGSGTSRVMRAAEDDAFAAPGALDARRAELGPEAMLADYGPNLRTQAGAIASQPGPGQQKLVTALADRAEGAGARVSGAADTAAGPAVDPAKQVESIISKWEATGQPLYGEAYATPIRGTPRMAELLQRPAVKAAIAQADRLSANEGQELGLNVRGIDLVQRTLADMASASARAGKTNAARIVDNLRRSLVEEVDKQAPKFAEARAAFSSRKNMEEALDSGRRVFEKGVAPDELAASLKGMTAGEREMHQHGARLALADVMGSARKDSTAASRLLEKNWNRDKLAQVVGPEEADRFLKTVGQETTFSNTGQKVTQGSDTAARRAAQTEFPNPAEKVPLPHLTLADIPVLAARKVGGAVMGAGTNARNARIGGDAAEALSATGTAHDALLEGLRTAFQGKQRAKDLGMVARRVGTLAPEAYGDQK